MHSGRSDRAIYFVTYEDPQSPRSGGIDAFFPVSKRGQELGSQTSRFLSYLDNLVSMPKLSAWGFWPTPS